MSLQNKGNYKRKQLIYLYFYLAPLVELVQDEFVQSKMTEAAKLFYSSDTVTINLAAVAAAGLLLLLCKSQCFPVKVLILI